MHVGRATAVCACVRRCVCVCLNVCVCRTLDAPPREVPREPARRTPAAPPRKLSNAQVTAGWGEPRGHPPEAGARAPARRALPQTSRAGRRERAGGGVTQTRFKTLWLPRETMLASGFVFGVSPASEELTLEVQAGIPKALHPRDAGAEPDPEKARIRGRGARESPREPPAPSGRCRGPGADNQSRPAPPKGEESERSASAGELSGDVFVNAPRDNEAINYPGGKSAALPTAPRKGRLLGDRRGEPAGSELPANFLINFSI